MTDDRDELRILEDGIDELAKLNLEFFREIAKGKHPDGVAPVLWVHVIHGTWANPEESKVRPTWSEPGGSLELALRKCGDAALWQKVRFARTPNWSGTNSFAARATATAQLRDYFKGVLLDKQTAFDRHVVIAHSHGGNVAANALRSLGPLAENFSGLLTLGTPFVQRVRKWEEQGEVSFDSITGIHAHAFALFFALTLAFCWLADGRYWLSAATTVVGAMPWILARFQRFLALAGGLSAAIPLTVVPVYWWVRPVSLGGLMSCAVGAFVVALFLASRMAIMHSVRFLGFNDGAAEDDLPPPLKTPLLAIRAPADEASLAISAASGAVFLSESLGAVGIKALRSVPGWIYAVLGAAMVISTWCALVWPGNGFWKTAVALSWSVPVVVPMVGLIVSLILKFGATLLIALACGPEALEAPGIVRVFAEPLPRSEDALGAPSTLRMVFPSSGDLAALRKGGTLRHSIYEYPSVQAYMADWILRHVVPPHEVAGG